MKPKLTHWERTGNKPSLTGFVACTVLVVACAHAQDLKTEFFEAAKNGDSAELRFLLAQSPGLPKAVDSLHYTPLHYAAAHGDVEAVRLLVLNQADVNATNCYGSTPLLLAKGFGHDEVAQFLEERGGKVPEVSRKPPVQKRTNRQGYWVDSPEIKVPNINIPEIPKFDFPNFDFPKSGGTRLPRISPSPRPGIPHVPQMAHFQVIKKKCSRCGQQVPTSSKPGGRCPHCHTLWGYETTQTVPSRNARR